MPHKLDIDAAPFGLVQFGMRWHLCSASAEMFLETADPELSPFVDVSAC